MEPFLVHPLPRWKRVLDVIGAAIALIVFSPVLLLVALAVKLTSRGPVLFMQRRSGLGGVPFVICKFRTMVVDARGPQAGPEEAQRAGRSGIQDEA